VTTCSTAILGDAIVEVQPIHVTSSWSRHSCAVAMGDTAPTATLMRVQPLNDLVAQQCSALVGVSDVQTGCSSSHSKMIWDSAQHIRECNEQQLAALFKLNSMHQPAPKTPPPPSRARRKERSVSARMGVPSAPINPSLIIQSRLSPISPNSSSFMQVSPQVDGASSFSAAHNVAAPTRSSRPTDSPRIILSGWIQKAPTRRIWLFGRVGRRRRRWCVLRTDFHKRVVLVYYDTNNPRMHKRKGFMRITHDANITRDNDTMFTLVAQGKTFQGICDDKNTTSRWITELSNNVPDRNEEPAVVRTCC